MSAFFPSSLSGFPFSSSSSSSSSSSKAPRSPSRLVAASSAIGLSHLLKAPRECLNLLVCSSVQDVHNSHYLLRLAENFCEHPLWSHSTLDSLVEACLSIQSSWVSFFSGKDVGSANEREGSSPDTSPRNSSDGRLWTNVLLTFNILVYVAQVATHGKLLLWGAKVNSLINEGQIWRLATSAFLHSDIIHLMVNCYSLNSVGPTVEKICGPKRYLAIYLGSAIASSALSYRFCRLPAIGASGAIFGLVASSALFIMRHRRFIRSGKEELVEIFKVIAINMAIGLSIKGIDNWGHVGVGSLGWANNKNLPTRMHLLEREGGELNNDALEGKGVEPTTFQVKPSSLPTDLGGLLGGAAITWFVGPLWRYEIRPEDGKPILADKAPIFRLTKERRPN